MQEEKCGREFLGYWDIGTERMFRSPTGLKFEKLGVKVSGFYVIYQINYRFVDCFPIIVWMFDVRFDFETGRIRIPVRF